MKLKFLSFAIFCLLTSTVFADIIHLKDGTDVYGNIVAEYGDVEILVQGKVVKYYSYDIESFEYEDPEGVAIDVVDDLGGDMIGNGEITQHDFTESSINELEKLQSFYIEHTKVVSEMTKLSQIEPYITREIYDDMKNSDFEESELISFQAMTIPPKAEVVDVRIENGQGMISIKAPSHFGEGEMTGEVVYVKEDGLWKHKKTSWNPIK